jgi:hypothetical protein
MVRRSIYRCRNVLKDMMPKTSIGGDFAGDVAQVVDAFAEILGDESRRRGYACPGLAARGGWHRGLA